MGEPADQVSQAIEDGLPVILVSLSEAINTNEGGPYVYQAMGNEANSGLLEHLDSVLQGQGLDLLSQQGAVYATSLFHGYAESLRHGLARTSGLGIGEADRLLCILIPVVLAVLGRHIWSTSITAEDFARALEEQKLSLFSRMPGPLRDIFIPAGITEANSEDERPLASSAEFASPGLAAAQRQVHPDIQAPPPPAATQKLFLADIPSPPASPLAPVTVARPAARPSPVASTAQKSPGGSRAWLGLTLLAILAGAGLLWKKWPLADKAERPAPAPAPLSSTVPPHEKPVPVRPDVAEASAPPPALQTKNEPPAPAPAAPEENTGSLLALPQNDPALTIGSALLPLPGIKGSLTDLQAAPADSSSDADPDLDIAPEAESAETTVATAPASSAGSLPHPTETPPNPVVPDPVEIPVETVQLPNGRQAKVNHDGLDGRLYDFLTKTAPNDITLVFDQVIFEEGNNAPEEISHRQLEAVAALLKAWPEASAVIQGHTDSSGKAAANLNISNARAAAVRKQLISLGARASQVEARGLGATKPLVPNDSEENRLKNRRVELVAKRK